MSDSDVEIIAKLEKISNQQERTDQKVSEIRKELIGTLQSRGLKTRLEDVEVSIATQKKVGLGLMVGVVVMVIHGLWELLTKGRME